MRNGTSWTTSAGRPTRPGRFTIRGKLTVLHGYDTEVHWIEPVRFRLRRG